MINIKSNIIKSLQLACRRKCQSAYAVLLPLLIIIATSITISCERKPDLHLHYGGGLITELPIVELELDVYWNYEIAYGINYDWRAEWFYGWDEIDTEIFGEQGYVHPEIFNLRRYYTGDQQYGPHTSVLASTVHGYTFEGTFHWGYWDLLAWNEITTPDGIQSLLFDETTTLEYVTVSTNKSMNSSRYQAPKFPQSFYQPEPLFAAYAQGIEINKELEGFKYDEQKKVWVKKIDMLLEPRTYIYLTQVILHNNGGRITGVDGSANLSGMARSVNLNTGVAGSDAITVHYNVRFKNNCAKNGESVDIAGGRLMTFGMCNVNGSRVGMSGRTGEVVTRVDDGIRHYMDVTMQFNNGMDSTFVFDVTEQVRRRYKGGVLTVELDMDTVPTPKRPGGSGFDAVVKDFEDGGTHEFDM